MGAHGKWRGLASWGVALALGLGTLQGCATGDVVSGQPVAAKPNPNGSGATIAFPGTPTPSVVVLATKKGLQFAEEAEPTAPNTFAIDQDKVYLYNPLDETIDCYQQGKLTHSTPVGNISVLDFLVADEMFIILDSNSNEIVKLNQSGQVTDRQTVPVPKSATPSSDTEVQTNPPTNAVRLELTADGYSVLLDDGTRISHEGQIIPDENQETFEFTHNGFVVLDAAGSVIRHIATPNEPYGIEEVYRDKESVYYRVADHYYDKAAGNIYPEYMFRYNGNVATASYTLSEAQHFVPNREIIVAGDAVYQLLITDDEVQVLRLSPDTSIQAES